MVGRWDAECWRRRRNRESERRSPEPITGTPKTATAAVRTALPSYGGGSYVNCSDNTRPVLLRSLRYLGALRMPISPNCQADRYYLLNNYNPGYFGDGSNAYTAIGSPYQTVFTIPPTTVRNMGDALNEKSVSWAYYGDQWNAYLKNPNLNYVVNWNQYCNICNFFQYSTSIMKDPKSRANLKDTTDLDAAIHNGTLPAVSYVKPSGWLDGHPASSKLDLFEGFVKKIVDELKSNKELWSNTAIFVTFDEGGGYYDSGYVQPLDFFGDGTRIPVLVVSSLAKPGYVSHQYTDHVSILKFVEANWKLKPLTSRSRDNYPNPITSSSNPYVPLNTPALGDLMDMFTFSK